jgi:hypothetical protein
MRTVTLMGLCLNVTEGLQFKKLIQLEESKMNTNHLTYEATVLQSMPLFYSVSNNVYEVTQIIADYKDKNIKNSSLHN